MNNTIIHNLFNYLRDKLSNKERYAFEKEISKDPFLEDALDGFSQLTPNELENDLDKLNARLQTRLKKTKSRNIIPILKIAAGITIIISIGSVAIYIGLYDISNKDIAENVKSTTISEKVETDQVMINEDQEPINMFKEDASQKQIVQSTITKKDDAVNQTTQNNKSIIPNKEKAKNETIAIINDIETESDKIVLGAEMAEDIQAEPASVMMISTPVNENTIHEKNNNQSEFEDYQITSNEEPTKKQKRRMSKSKSSIEYTDVTNLRLNEETILSEQNMANWIMIYYVEDIEKHSSPINGNKEFEEHIKRNTLINPKIPTSVKLAFIVETDGSINKIEILDSPNKEYSNEAIRLINNTKWIPAKDNNENVKEKVMLTITFQL